MNTVIFACIHNAGRSQMAAAWFNALCDSSKAKYAARSPRRQAASAKCAAKLLLPVPAVPETSTLLPR